MSNIRASIEEIEKASKYYMEASKPFMDAMRVVIGKSPTLYRIHDGKVASILAEREYILEIEQILLSIRKDVDIKLSQGYFR